MDRKDLLDFLDDGETTVILEPNYLDQAIVGLTTDHRVVYSRDLLEQAFAQHDGMTPEEAKEWVDYNTIRSIPYMGAQSPIVLEYTVTNENSKNHQPLQ